MKLIKRNVSQTNSIYKESNGINIKVVTSLHKDDDTISDCQSSTIESDDSSYLIWIHVGFKQIIQMIDAIRRTHKLSGPELIGLCRGIFSAIYKIKDSVSKELANFGLLENLVETCAYGCTIEPNYEALKEFARSNVGNTINDARILKDITIASGDVVGSKIVRFFAKHFNYKD